MFSPQQKIPIGILGATGMVGQQYIKLLANHPWFEIKFLAASAKSAGLEFSDAVRGRWHMNIDIPKNIATEKVYEVNEISRAKQNCKFVFSALEMESRDELKELENKYAASDLPVVSNASANRDTDDVPMIIPEINHAHLDIIPLQQKHHGWKNGFIVVKPNCSLQSYLTPIYALQASGFEIKKIFVSTMQAVSGAGYPGVANLDIIDNVVPYIASEEEKTEKEPLKILGKIENEKFIHRDDILISAHCNRVPVCDGHLACVSILFGDKKPEKDEIIKIWKDFKSLPQEFNLPSAPENPIIYRKEENRPQPKKDRENDKAMAVTIGRLRKCNVFDFKFVGLSHNTVRGAAGGGILNAELLVAKGYIST